MEFSKVKHIQFIPASNVHVARAIRGCHGGVAIEGLKEMDKAFHEMRKLEKEHVQQRE